MRTGSSNLTLTCCQRTQRPDVRTVEPASAAAWLRDAATPRVRERLRPYSGMSRPRVQDVSYRASGSRWRADPACAGRSLVVTYRVSPRCRNTAHDEEDALDRLSTKPELVPDGVRQSSTLGATTLFATRAFPSPFEPPEIDPFPAAVRALAALRLASTDELLSALAILAAGPTASKLQAARTLSTITAVSEHTPEWAVAIALQLSSDTNANVRAETGRTLAVALQHTQFAQTLVQSRLLGLLEEDGILVPLLVLQGLTSDVDLTPGAIYDRVAQMAHEHPVFGVRVQARYVLGRLS